MAIDSAALAAKFNNYRMGSSTTGLNGTFDLNGTVAGGEVCFEDGLSPAEIALLGSALDSDRSLIMSAAILNEITGSTIDVNQDGTVSGSSEITALKTALGITTASSGDNTAITGTVTLSSLGSQANAAANHTLVFGSGGAGQVAGTVTFNDGLSAAELDILETHLSSADYARITALDTQGSTGVTVSDGAITSSAETGSLRTLLGISGGGDTTAPTAGSAELQAWKDKLVALGLCSSSESVTDGTITLIGGGELTAVELGDGNITFAEYGGSLMTQACFELIDHAGASTTGGISLADLTWFDNTITNVMGMTTAFGTTKTDVAAKYFAANSFVEISQADITSAASQVNASLGSAGIAAAENILGSNRTGGSSDGKLDANEIWFLISQGLISLNANTDADGDTAKEVDADDIYTAMKTKFGATSPRTSGTNLVGTMSGSLMIGDVDGNGTINATTDAALYGSMLTGSAGSMLADGTIDATEASTLNSIAGLSGSNALTGAQWETVLDVNNDGSFNATDQGLISSYNAGSVEDTEDSSTQSNLSDADKKKWEDWADRWGSPASSPTLRSVIDRLISEGKLNDGKLTVSDLSEEDKKAEFRGGGQNGMTLEEYITEEASGTINLTSI